MSTENWSAWLHRGRGTSVAVPPRGLILGRRPDCDVVLASGRASQVQAIITPTLDGLELLSLGRNPTRVDGNPVTGRTLLQHKSTVQVPGASFEVELSKTTFWSAQVWTVQLPDDHQYALRRLPYRMGNSRSDHLRIDGWPASAIEFHAADGGMAIEFLSPGQLNGIPMDEGAIEMAREDDQIAFNDTVVRVGAVGGDARETTVLLGHDGVESITFTFLPTGARLDVRFTGDDTSRQVVLSELRARLLAALLQPPSGYDPGDLVPDEILIPAIWSSHSGRTRVDVNVLIYRTRRFLLKSGLNPDRLISRARLGGSTRVLLVPGAQVVVE